MPRFNPDKATDAVALLVKLAGGRLNKVAAIKLLYFAERESLATTGITITDSTFYSIQRGPVSSEILALMDTHTACGRWPEYLRTVDYNVELVKPPRIEELSRYHITLIRKHWRVHRESFAPTDFPQAIVDYSNTLGEWKDPGPGARIPITLRDMLEAQHLPTDTIDAIITSNQQLPEWIDCNRN